MTTDRESIKVLVTESHAGNTGDLIGLDDLKRLIDRDMVSPCEECSMSQDVWHLEPGVSWFAVNKAARKHAARAAIVKAGHEVAT